MMVDKKRDIFIKIQNVENILEVLTNIKKQEEYLTQLFEGYDSLNIEENKIFDNWSNNLEEVIQRLEHVTL